MNTHLIGALCHEWKDMKHSTNSSDYEAFVELRQVLKQQIVCFNHVVKYSTINCLK